MGENTFPHLLWLHTFVRCCENFPLFFVENQLCYLCKIHNYCTKISSRYDFRRRLDKIRRKRPVLSQQVRRRTAISLQNFFKKRAPFIVLFFRLQSLHYMPFSVAQPFRRCALDYIYPTMIPVSAVQVLRPVSLSPRLLRL